MVIKIDGRQWSNQEHAVMLILTDQEKAEIAQLPDGVSKYALFPEWFGLEDRKDWMDLIE